MKRKFMKYIVIILSVATITFGNILYAGAKYEDGKEEKVKIAIVIDDFGNGGEGTEEMLNLNIPITAAVMPFAPYGSEEARMAKEKGKEVIIHMPMEPEQGKAHWLGKRPILSSLSSEEVEKRVREAVDEVNVAKGMNNHMGSKITKDERVLREIFKILKEKDMFFLDSKTTGKSKVPELCKEMGIPYYERDVFLDHVHSLENVEKQMENAYKIAREKGYAVIIGHVGAQGGKITVNGIKNKIENFQKRGVEFVFISQIQKK
ncbi:divergent polysaccharide deacetylase family protein [Clostridium sp.]|uniref:divergent polysaccharide deacetylase family protein n=1 Tax=Clostridium sp. TaxID=1506 RepID=UPI003463DC39